MFYIYILHSATSNKYYIGYSSDYTRRLEEHNTSPKTTYTSKHRPWVLKAAFYCGTDRAEAMKMEKFIKKQKSIAFIEKLVDGTFIPQGPLTQLVRVPQRN